MIPLTTYRGALHDVVDGRRVRVHVGDGHMITGLLVGPAALLGAQVLVLQAYDQAYVLAIEPAPSPAAPYPSKDPRNALQIGEDGGWEITWDRLHKDAQGAPTGDWMPRTGGVFTGAISVPTATQPDQPVTLGAFQAFVGAYLPWTARIVAYADARGRVKVLIGGNPANPYYVHRTEAPAWVLVTPHVNADPAQTVGAGTALTAALGGMPAPTADEVWVGGFKPESLVEFTLQVGWRAAPLYAWDHQPPTGGGGAITAPPAATAPRSYTASGPQTWRTFAGDGNPFWDQGRLYFGWYSAQFGAQSSADVFGAADVAALRAIPASSVTGGTLRLTWAHTWGNSGGAVRLRVCGSLPDRWQPGAGGGEYVDVALPAKSGTTTVALPPSVVQQFCSGGAAQGFAIEPAWPGQSGYGYLTPGSLALTANYVS